MTIEDWGVEKNHIHRNENICKVFQTTEYMEHIGTGIAHMRNEMEKSNLPEPEFEDGSYIRVVLRGPNGKLILPQNPTAEDFENMTLTTGKLMHCLK